jgi:rRNA maturation protein Nop10
LTIKKAAKFSNKNKYLKSNITQKVREIKLDEKEKKICGNCLFARKYEDWIYKCEKSRRFTSEKDTCKNWAPAK